MLVLTRTQGQRMYLGGTVTLTVVECSSGSVCLGFEAPPTVPLLREATWSPFREYEVLPRCAQHPLIVKW
jgi:sRNA-binding carbon storage regulator CsrA